MHLSKPLALLLLVGCASTTEDIQSNPAALDEFALGADRAPTASTLQSMASILAAQGRASESEFVLQRLIAEYPLHAPAYNDLAELYIRADNLDSALATLDLGVKSIPGDPVLLNNAGLCRILMGDFDGALSWFQEATEARPDDASLRANLALALGLVGRTGEARALYEQVMTPAAARHNLLVIETAREGADARAMAEVIQGLDGPVGVPVAPADENSIGDQGPDLR